MEVFPSVPYLKKQNRLLCALLAVLMAGLLSSCTGIGGTEKDSRETQSPQPIYTLTREDKRTDPKNADDIRLDSVGKELLITDAGDYLLSGSLSGSIHIKAEEQVVHLFLQNVSVKSTTAPALYVESAGKVIVTVCEGTSNSLIDGSKYIDRQPDGCIFSMCDLTVNGTGKLTVSGYYKDAVHTKDFLKIIDAELSVLAKSDGLHGNDGIMIIGANIAVEAENNGLRTTKTGKETKGSIEIADTSLSVIAGENAVSASRNITIVSSGIFVKGIQSNFKANGEIYIEEGSLRNE